MNRVRLRLLHAVHDFLPRHRAGSEIYVHALAQQQARCSDVAVLAAEYDPAAPHGTIRWRAHDGLPVVEVVNNWQFAAFEETYSSPRLNRQLEHVLEAIQPDVLHVHNLLNLTFDLPRLARARGIPVVATLHDYTLVCASGGQRVHVAESHVCHSIEPARCGRCFTASPFQAQLKAGGILRRTTGPVVRRAAGWLRQAAPGFSLKAARRVPGVTVGAAEISRRLQRAQAVFREIDLFVAPSQSLADEFVRLGLPGDRIVVSDYGSESGTPEPRAASRALRIGFVGTLVWHKGAHVLVEACRSLIGNYRVEVFGDPTVFPEYSAELVRQATGLPLRFRGPFERSERDRVYSGIDVLVVPSLWPENSPLVIHEAFMHRTVVVAARVGGIPELVTDTVNGLLYEPFSAAGLARSLQTLIDDRDLLARLAAARPAVKSIQHEAREWEERYRQVLSARTAATLV